MTNEGLFDISSDAQTEDNLGGVFRFHREAGSSHSGEFFELKRDIGHKELNPFMLEICARFLSESISRQFAVREIHQLRLA